MVLYIRKKEKRGRYTFFSKTKKRGNKKLLREIESLMTFPTTNLPGCYGSYGEPVVLLNKVRHQQSYIYLFI